MKRLFILIIICSNIFYAQSFSGILQYDEFSIKHDDKYKNENLYLSADNLLNDSLSGFSDQLADESLSERQSLRSGDDPDNGLGGGTTDDDDSPVSVDDATTSNKKIWLYGDDLFIETDESVTLHIYPLTGHYYSFEVPSGISSIKLRKGIYVIRMNNEKPQKIIL